MPAVVKPALFRSLIITWALAAYVPFAGGGILPAICGRPGSLTRPVGFPEASFSIHGWFIVASPTASIPLVLRKPQHRENWTYTGLFGAAWSSSAFVNGVGLSVNWS